ncbi:hypothetical protein [Solibacillus sp. FSL H8-0538]
MKNKLATACGIISAVIGVILIGNYTWRYIDSRFADTFQLLLKLF